MSVPKAPAAKKAPKGSKTSKPEAARAKLRAIRTESPGSRAGAAPPPVPGDLSASGQELWAAVVGAYDLEVHELLQLRQACRMVDNLDRLAAEAAQGDVTVINQRGDRVTHPAIVESRQQARTLATLLASIRLPSGEEGSRPQRRGAVRGSYGLRSKAGAE
jgi:hypothetical protein